MSPAWPHPVDTPPPADPLDALYAELDALQKECYAALRTAHLNGPIFIGRRHLDRLNEKLAEVKAINKTLFHPLRSSEIAAWPDPVLPTNVLLGVRNLLPYVGMAFGAVSGAIQQRSSWFHQHRDDPDI